MAFYILILKEQEDEEKVIYGFGPDEQHLGSLTVNKKDGKIEEVRSAPVNKPSAYFTRAAAKVYKSWQRGELPKKTQWAS